MLKHFKEIKTGFKNSPGTYAKEVIKFAIGFVLSPLTWWNDLFINVPLAWIFAYATGKIIYVFTDISLFIFTMLFLLGYIITNVIGILMMGSSLQQVTKKKSKTLVAGVVAGVVYSIVIVLLSYSELAQGLSIVPEWVVK